MICNGLSRKDCLDLYADILSVGDREAQRRLCREDLFFLLTVALNRGDADRPWLFERVREVEASPDGHLDLWAREHFKSTIVTFGLTIQDVLSSHGDRPLPKWNGREVTVGIFSHTRPIAKAFLAQIKAEFENNEYLQKLFPDVLYAEPTRESPHWSLDSGILVKRKSNPREMTVEAWGLVDGQPTSMHYFIVVYDDVVTRESVTTPDQISKTTAAWELSLNLGAEGGKRRYVGTRYHFNDTYATMIARKAVAPRIYPATVDGTETGAPVLFSRELLAEKRRDMGVWTFGAQMLLNPAADTVMGFDKDWLRYVTSEFRPGRNWNRYLLVDPAGSKKKLENDYAVFVVVGLAPDGNYYLLDGVRDRLNLTERAALTVRLHRKWRPVMTGYEEYGMQADIEHVKTVQERENYRFDIRALGGNSLSKVDRIRRLVPVFEQGKFWLPRRLLFSRSDGTQADFVAELVNDEYTGFPVAKHDDMLDDLSRIVDPALGAVFPALASAEGLFSAAPAVQIETALTNPKYQLFG